MFAHTKRRQGAGYRLCKVGFRFRRWPYWDKVRQYTGPLKGVIKVHQSIYGQGFRHIYSHIERGLSRVASAGLGYRSDVTRMHTAWGSTPAT